MNTVRLNTVRLTTDDMTHIYNVLHDLSVDDVNVSADVRYGATTLLHIVDSEPTTLLVTDELLDDLVTRLDNHSMVIIDCPATLLVTDELPDDLVTRLDNHSMVIIDCPATTTRERLLSTQL